MAGPQQDHSGTTSSQSSIPTTIHKGNAGTQDGQKVKGTNTQPCC